MATSGGAAGTQLRHVIFYHLDNDLVETANFLAGRLYAADNKNADHAHLLSLTYLRLRRYKAARDFAAKSGASGKHLGCAYVYAQACLQLGMHTEGATALERARPLWVGKSDWNKCSETSRRHLPDAPAVFTLMAKLWQAHGDMKKAADCYVEAHKANAFIWDAFEGLCKVGADLNVSQMFRLPPEQAQLRHAANTKPVIYTDEESSLGVHALQNGHGRSTALQTPSSDPFGPSKGSIDYVAASFAPHNLNGKRTLTYGPTPSSSEWDTPTATIGSTDDDIIIEDSTTTHDADNTDFLAAPARRAHANHLLDPSDRLRPPALRNNLNPGLDGQHLIERRVHGGATKRTNSGQPTRNVPAAANDLTAAPRRSNRLYGQAVPATSHNTNMASTRTTRSATDASTFASRVERVARAPRVATGAKNRLGSTVGRVVSGNRKVLPPDPAEKDKEKRSQSRASERTTTAPGVTAAIIQKPAPTAPAISLENTQQIEQQAISGLLENFRQLAVGSYAISRFDLPRAIQTFKSLPVHARDNPWVLAQLGKAHYEAVNYKAAEECFARVLRLQPSHTEDMEVYSTVLWHLKKDAALACLCHTLKDQDFHAPQTWCAVGNAFSLARDHDQAIAAFKRATQLDDNFAYAWTLMGHEYIANEEFEMGLTAFRKSVAVDRRGYGGWYGLGKSYERMGKLEEAERHYQIAAAINPSNATLLVCIGVVLERLQNRDAALAYYGKALELAPNSALARFKKARVLMHLRYYAEALRELEDLRDQAPDEANVWFLLGKCHKSLGDKSEALRALTTALNLDVKAASFIKEAMEALDDEDDESDMD